MQVAGGRSSGVVLRTRALGLSGQFSVAGVGRRWAAIQPALSGQFEGVRSSRSDRSGQFSVQMEEMCAETGQHGRHMGGAKPYKHGARLGSPGSPYKNRQ